jgi:hypothetical protein
MTAFNREQAQIGEFGVTNDDTETRDPDSPDQEPQPDPDQPDIQPNPVTPPPDQETQPS